MAARPVDDRCAAAVATADSLPDDYLPEAQADLVGAYLPPVGCWWAGDYPAAACQVVPQAILAAHSPLVDFPADSQVHSPLRGRSCRFSRRRAFYKYRPSCRCGAYRRSQLCQFLPSQRLTGMLRQRLLSGRERRERRRGSCLRNHLPLRDRWRRRGYVVRRVGMRSEHSVLRGWHGRSHAYPCSRNLLRIDGHVIVCDRLRARKGALRALRSRLPARSGSPNLRC